MVRNAIFDITVLQKSGNGSKQLKFVTDFANLKDLRNLIHCFDPTSKIFT